MSGLPAVQILLDDGTGTFPLDITSKALLLEGMTLGRGRDDWQSAVTAGEAGAALNNADGRFTPGSNILGSPSPIVVDQRARIKEIVNGTTYTRYTGYVKSWPVTWPATVQTISTVRVSATDAQARAERRVLKTIIEEEILADSPLAYYTMSDPAADASGTATTSAVDSSGNQQQSLAQFGTGTAATFGVDGPTPAASLTAASSVGGKYFAPATRFASGLISAYELVFKVASPPGSERGIISAEWDVGLNGPPNTFILTMNTSGQIKWAGSTTATNYADGAFHHLFWDTTTGKLYIDGALIGTDLSGLVVLGLSPITGTLAHIALWTSVPSAGRIAAHASAVANGFAGEAGTSRLTRLAGYAGIAIGTLDTSLTNVPFVDFAGQSAWDAIQAVADAEFGVAFIDETGSLDFHNRNKVAAKTSPDLSLDKQWLTGDVQASYDDSQIINWIDVTPELTGSTQVARNTASETSHGRYTDSKSYLVSTDAEALDRANWIVGQYAQPSVRYGTLTINLYGMTAVQQQAVIAAIEINCWLRVTGMPTQNTGGSTVDLVVQGWTEEQTDRSWLLRCNVVSRSLFAAWILGDSTYGVLGSTTELYV